MDKKRVLRESPELGSILLRGLNAANKALAIPLLLLITAWQRLISPILGQRCRFYPSCSQYAAEALREHGFLYGTALLLQRIARCNALFEGGFDPLPRKKKVTIQ